MARTRISSKDVEVAAAPGVVPVAATPPLTRRTRSSSAFAFIFFYSIAIILCPAAASPDSLGSIRNSAASGRLALERKHGEPFPLPRPPALESRPGGGAPRYAVQRWKRKLQLRERVSEAVVGLNQLAVARASGLASLGIDNFGARSASATQTSILDSLSRRISAAGRPPRDLDESRALKELMSSRSLYGQEPANLAP